MNNRITPEHVEQIVVNAAEAARQDFREPLLHDTLESDRYKRTAQMVADLTLKYSRATIAAAETALNAIQAERGGTS